MPVTVRTQYCVDKDGTICFLVIEKDGKEYLKLPIYLSNEAEKQLPQLRDGINQLPEFIEMIYNSGKRNEDIEFVKEHISLN